MDQWRSVKLPAGSKLFKVHSFTLMHKGSTFALEIDEFMDGTFTGYGEHSTDKSRIIDPVNGKSLNDCLQQLVQKVEARG